MKRTVVIGASPRQFIPAKVCEYTVRRLASAEVDVLHTYDREFDDDRLRAMNRTGFSFVRFAVPELAGYQGRAVYLDSDMLVFRDIVDLFSLSLDDASVLRPKNQTAVLLYDCERLVHWRWSEYRRKIGGGDYRYRDLMETLYEPRLKVGIPPEWNHLDSYSPKATAILHYTDMARQPWRYERHPLAGVWFEQLRGAIKAEFLTLADVHREVEAGHVGGWLLKEVAARA